MFETSDNSTVDPKNLEDLEQAFQNMVISPETKPTLQTFITLQDAYKTLGEDNQKGGTIRKNLKQSLSINLDTFVGVGNKAKQIEKVFGKNFVHSISISRSNLHKSKIDDLI
ncbi:710_t:CDS:1, partial [Racocetra fulgida]